MNSLSALDKALISGNLSYLYRMDSFDFLVLSIYFLTLIVLSVYGVRRFYYLRLFKKYKNFRFRPLKKFPEEPMVTVQLPMYNEMYVGPRVLDAVCKLDWPKNKLHIQVLDDSTDETVEIMKRSVKYWRDRGFDIEYIHRKNRVGFKAGALENGLKTAKGEIIAIFDADFIPHEDFLRKTVDYFTDEEVGIVQTRWVHINRDYSLLTKLQSILLDGHFMLESLPRSRAGFFVNFNGTAGLWRKRAIEDAGGWEHDTITEDLDLSLRAQLKGWKFVYLPEVVCPAELPVEMNGFKSQQNRWAKGGMQVCKKLLPKILKSDIDKKIKEECFFHLSSNISYPLMILLSIMILPVIIVRFNQGVFEMLFLDLPIFVASTLFVFLFYLESQRALYVDWKKRAFLIPLAMSLGVGISLINGKGVIEAILGIKSSFVRTPKYSIVSKIDSWTGKKYREKIKLTTLFEIGFVIYFLWICVYSTLMGNVGVVPFMLFFIFGFSYTGFSSLFSSLKIGSPFSIFKFRRNLEAD